MRSPEIDKALVEKLVASQFPELAHLPVRAVDSGGWDNRTFHLGEALIVRLPSAAPYAAHAQKEWAWLPRLASHLPLQIPIPVAMGAAGEGYPFPWSIYRWIEGESEAQTPVADLCMLAADLARFLRALWSIDTTGGPLPGADNFHRGGSLSVYDAQFRDAALLCDCYPNGLLQRIWEAARRTNWSGTAVWVHGDLAPGNLIVRDGRLRAVIDFGQLAVGDPACDLAIAWRRFDPGARRAFRAALRIDDGTWLRGRAWALWKALIVRGKLVQTNTDEAAAANLTLDEIIADL